MTKNNMFLSISKVVLTFFVFVSCLVVLLIEISSFDLDQLKDKNSAETDVGVLTKKVVTESKVGMPGENKQTILTDEILADDARLMIIESYLKKYKSPLLPYASLILELSDNYVFDYRWIVAIGQQESNLCKKIPEDSYNCWGYGIHSEGTLRFDGYDLALRSFASYLKTQYFDKGYNTPELIMSKYCPHSNGSWAYGIRQFFGEMERG